MGESIVKASNSVDKMRESAPVNPVLELSVSFGRFENDSLSWEKWSSFSQNKYLEEVGKCATPGSVAKKKAYFEEHYKKVAARKAELLGQEKSMESKSFKSVDRDQNGGDLMGESNGQCSVEEVKQEGNLTSEVNDISDEEPDKEDGTTTELQSSSSQAVIEEKDSGLESPKPCEPGEAVSVKEEETHSNNSQDKRELPQGLEKEKEDAKMIKEKSVKVDHLLKSHKITTPVKKERNVAEVKKKPASPVNKTPQFYTPRTSKPTSTPTTAPSSRTSTKVGTVSSLTRTKNPPMGESKKVASKSLHLSFRLEPSGSNQAPLATTRKSLIMEKMGDKNIVKRAFKTFQSNYNQLKSSSQEQSKMLKGPKQVPSKGTEPRVSTLVTPRKENGGFSRAGGVEKKNAKAAPSNFRLKSDERAEKKEEFSKKLVEESNTREAERTRLQTKSKENREADIKKSRQNHNFKATPMPSFSRGQKLSNSHVDKDTKNHNLP
ncbi:hypothetical protein SLA2020_141990 [Shorea laevis]